jgi:hypothetical protein
MTIIFGWITIFLGIVGYIPYILSLYRKQTKPHVFSWFLWGLLTGIAFYAQLSAGAGPGAWVTGLTAVICLGIAGYAVFHGEKHITRSDWMTFIAGLCAIPVWIFTADPLWAIVWVTIIDALGFYPTFRKSYYKPFEEEPLTYALCALKFFVAIFALENFNLTTALYQFSLVVMNGLFVAMVLYRRKALGKAYG